MAQKNNHLVIMAGGVGSRFWPMSTAEKPKQFIDVLGVGKTLLQLTVERFNKLVSPENIWVVTNQKYVDIVREQLPEMPAGNILCEPCRRNTAPCIAYVSWRQRCQQEIFYASHAAEILHPVLPTFPGVLSQKTPRPILW